MLLASIFFYGYWDYRFVGLLLISISFDYWVAQKIYSSPRTKRNWMCATVVLNMSVLIFFKYFNFFSDSFIPFLQQFGLSNDQTSIVLPIGISFYTFQTLSYSIDVYRQKLKPINNLIDFVIYVSFFPQLVAGPIERAASILPQLQSKLTPTKDQIKEGFFLIVIGLFQKVMIGDACSRVVDHVFFDMTRYSSFEVCCALFLFSFQIYADFSGYSNMARGIAKLVGIDLQINFRQPYFSKNLSEFWQRWHISLSTWFRDYLYIPLGGNKKSNIRVYLNLIVVFVLAGIWHGAGINFLCWGVYHGVFLIVSKLLKKIYVPKFVGVVVTFFIVLIGWSIFRIETIGQWAVLYDKLINFTIGSFYIRFLMMVFTYGIAIISIDWAQVYWKDQAILNRLSNQYIALGIAAGLLFVSFVFILLNKPTPFLYFQF